MHIYSQCMYSVLIYEVHYKTYTKQKWWKQGMNTIEKILIILLIMMISHYQRDYLKTKYMLMSEFITCDN
jgi:TRAP-type C4-dicarboxylate transport system permease large subunit